MGSVLQQTDFDFIASVKNEEGKHNAIVCCRLLGTGQPLSLVLIKAVASLGFPQPPGQLQQYIIPFWNGVLMGSDLQKTEFDFIASVKNMEEKKHGILLED